MRGVGESADFIYPPPTAPKGKQRLSTSASLTQLRMKTSMKKIQLTKNKYALVDGDLFDELNRFNWCVVPSGRTSYAMRNAKVDGDKYKAIKMHHAILGVPEKGMEVDHIDGDGLNNQRKNLRWATKNQNQHNRRLGKNNSSGIKGVHLSPSGKWQARAQLNGVRINLGFYTNKVDAGKAYEVFAKKNFGKFAKPI